MKASAQTTWARWRDRLRDRPNAEFGYRIVVAVIGLAVLGCRASSRSRTPGPGWAIVFVGLAILATEFDWARRLLAYTRERYDKVMAWFKRAGLWVQALGAAFTAAIVVGDAVVARRARLVGGAGRHRTKWLKSPIGLGA